MTSARTAKISMKMSTKSKAIHRPSKVCATTYTNSSTRVWNFTMSRTNSSNRWYSKTKRNSSSFRWRNLGLKQELPAFQKAPARRLQSILVVGVKCLLGRMRASDQLIESLPKLELFRTYRRLSKTRSASPKAHRRWSDSRSEVIEPVWSLR